jgi:endonuclease/exonuclease/phosphatase family metal-dependent hydrolase
MAMLPVERPVLWCSAWIGMAFFPCICFNARMIVRWNCLFAILAIPLFFPAGLRSQTNVPVSVSTNSVIRVVAANLTSGSNQRYETPGLNILKGLKPDVVAIQEFNYRSATLGTDTAAAFREMIDNTFGTNFVYFRESGKPIPNGIISRFPILSSGVWEDVEIAEREFVWARLDIPGTNELYVVSVHLKASDTSADRAERARQADALKTFIQSSFPTNAFIVLAGDMNIGSSSEDALTTFKTFLSDSPIPTDGFSGSSTNMNTNLNRSKRYDYVFPSFTLATNRVATVIGSRTFTNGLVFDSRVYTPLSEVYPVKFDDSMASSMQHMAVVKDFRISYTITNYVSVTAPLLSISSNKVVRWSGQSNFTYTVRTSTNLTGWTNAGTAFSGSTNFSFTNSDNSSPRRYFRVTYP